MEAPKFTTGSQIRAARALLGWRRSDLATAAGLHRNSVNYWESRNGFPRHEQVGCRRIRKALREAGVVPVHGPGVSFLPENERVQ